MDDPAFRSAFAGSPIKRIGRDRMVRNALYAVGNQGIIALRGVVRALCADPDEGVSDAARWALETLDQTPVSRDV